MTPISKLDSSQIIRYTFDEEAQAQRVTIMPTEMSFQAESKTVVEADGAVNCAGYAYACLFGTATVEISAEEDGSGPVSLTITEGVPVLICATTIIVTGTGKVVIRGT